MMSHEPYRMSQANARALEDQVVAELAQLGYAGDALLYARQGFRRGYLSNVSAFLRDVAAIDRLARQDAPYPPYHGPQSVYVVEALQYQPHGAAGYARRPDVDVPPDVRERTQRIAAESQR